MAMMNTMKIETSYSNFGYQYGSLEQNSSSYDSEENSSIESNQSNQIKNNIEQKHSIFLKVIIASGLVLLITFAAVTLKSNGYTLLSSLPKSSSLDSTSIVREVYGNLEEYQKEALFRLFVDTYGKEYKTDEYATRFAFFEDYLNIVDARNMMEEQAGGSAVHGITKFSDLSPVEFESYLGYDISTSSLSLGETITNIDEYTGDQDEVDWTGIYTTTIKEQGYCGSCWAFTAASQIESDAIRSSILTTDDEISTQQFVSCDEDSGGCNGGDPLQAYEYVMSTGGINLESNYPYTSSSNDAGTCDNTKNDYAISVNKYYKISGSDVTEIETNMINYVKSTGPLSVCFDATSLASYTSGVMLICGTNGVNDVNHCAQIVGVNTEEGYWKIRNSWGTSWGEDGYFRLQLNSDTCGITTTPAYTHVYQTGSDQVDITEDNEEDKDEDNEEDKDEEDEDEDEDVTEDEEDEVETNESVPSFIRGSTSKKSRKHSS